MLSDSEYDEYHREYDDGVGDLIIINRMNSHGYSPQGSLHKLQSSEILENRKTKNSFSLFHHKMTQFKNI